MKPCQVTISGFGGNIKPLELLGVGFNPTPQVGVTVGKGQHATVSMSAGCGVLPSPARGSRLNGEIAVIDAVGALIEKNMAWDLAVANAGRSMPARIAMMAITTSSSMSVKAFRPKLRDLVFKGIRELPVLYPFTGVDSS